MVLCIANACCPFTVVVTQNNGFAYSTEAMDKLRVFLFLSKPFWLSSTYNIGTQSHKVFSLLPSSDRISISITIHMNKSSWMWRRDSVFVLLIHTSQTEENVPCGCCLTETQSPWLDMRLFECSVYMWWEAQCRRQMSEWLEVSARLQNRPGSLRQDAGSRPGAASPRLPAVLSSQEPCLTAHATPDGLFDSRQCDTSVSCHIVSYVSARQTRPEPLNALRVYKQRGSAADERRGRALRGRRQEGQEVPRARRYLSRPCHTTTEGPLIHLVMQTGAQNQTSDNAWFSY